MYRLSIIDDDTVLLSLLKDMFELRSWEVSTYDNPVYALEQLRKELPQVILCDVLMPQMNGFELCKELRTDAAFARIPIYLMSAKHSINELTKALMSGADEYVIKPFQPEEMHERLLSGILKKNNPLKIKPNEM